jgi:hypothetical protein
MADENPPAEDAEQGEERAAEVEGGSYDVLRARLQAQGRELAEKADQLNGRRKETFGGSDLEIIGNEKIRTENNCIPVDIVSVGGLLWFGYNVYIGLRTQTNVSDVFALHRFTPTPEGYDLSTVPLDEGLGGFLAQESFVHDFEELYKYYKDAYLLQLRRTDTKLLATFQVGTQAEDIRVFRWAYDGKRPPTYIDDRGERDNVFPPSHDFEWVETTRDQHVQGRHPHVSIHDKVFVETVGGDLTIKVEDNTDDGAGIYAEPVDDAHQSLDDGKISFAEVGTLVLLRVLPYREEQWRHFIFNTRTQSVLRIDAIGEACIQLPEDHGVIFPGGYYLRTGERKVFEEDAADLKLVQTVRAPNGEDVLYAFFQPREGRYVLLPYNLIRKEVQNPIHCHGYSIFDDGKMLYFRSSSEEPVRVHTMQIWQTPFTSTEFAAAEPTDGSYLAKVGNAELVRGISDALSIRRMTEASDATRHAYEDLLKATTRAVDAYYWLGNEAVGDLLSTVKLLRSTAESILDEFDKVVAIRQRAEQALAEAKRQQHEVTRKLRPEDLPSVEAYMGALTALRSQRGQLIGLRELRYMELSAVDELEAEIVEAFDTVSGQCVDFLLGDEAFAPLVEQIEQLDGEIAGAGKAAELEQTSEKVDSLGDGLDVLSEIAGGLQVGDATARTTILESISEVFAQLNRLRAALDSRRKSILGAEGRAEFAAQFKLLSQSVDSALGRADTPEACDEQLSRLMLQLEEVESRFSEFDEFLGQLADKREEIYEALTSRKQTLVEERQRRAQNLFAAGERILVGVGRRAKSFRDEQELNAYFAADPMLLKLRELVERLAELGDSVKSDELESRLKSSRQDALRLMRDRSELFEDGAAILRFGRHRFSVNTQPLELTMVPRADDEGRTQMAFHLTGTDFYQLVDDPEFADTADLWEQTLVSESTRVYRAEYLAAEALAAAEAREGELSVERLQQAQVGGNGGLLALLRDFAASRYDEGYERGVHDADAAAILDRLLALRTTAGLLRYPSAARAVASFFWAFGAERRAERWSRRAASLARLRQSFAHSPAVAALGDELAEAITTFVEESGHPKLSQQAPLAGEYLAEELLRGGTLPLFTVSGEAERLREALLAQLDASGDRGEFEDDLMALADRPGEALALAEAWVEASLIANPDPPTHLALEAAVLLCSDGRLEREVSSAGGAVTLEGILGQHPRVVDGELELRLDEFLDRLGRYRREQVPRYRSYRKRRAKLVDNERVRLRLDEFKPRVLTSFVRNKLVNDIYLPLIGDNLAKQLGAAGGDKRTDLMGLLLLVSPPGYGKTTLMEYVASQLGLVFMKVNGPSLGHDVVSLDPSEAPNATARQEVNKINLALEMGNNVMLYLDDIQHTNAELLQKFISLCDAQRRVEGVWRGRTRTYDLRGKKFCMVMAGNPYTESGEKFQIPDMLANRADTYNLGDILEGKGDAFALSYLENSLTSNPSLAPLAGRPQKDVYLLVRMAQGQDVPATELSHPYSAAELSEITAVLRHLFVGRDLLLTVNAQYIESAGQDDDYRTEPRFQLQGSYRNMNKIAEKVVSAMNEQELASLLTDHYVGEAQTLTTGAEHNLLKLGELRGTLGPEESARWQQIKDGFGRKQRLGGSADDPAVRLIAQLGDIGDRLDGIRAQVEKASTESALRAEAELVEVEQDPLGPGLEQLGGGLGQLGGGLSELTRKLELLAQPQIELNLETKLPAGVTDLLDHQVALVERILGPLVRTLTRSLEDGESMRLAVMALLDDLKRVEQRLRQSTPEELQRLEDLGGVER